MSSSLPFASEAAEPHTIRMHSDGQKLLRNLASEAPENMSNITFHKVVRTHSTHAQLGQPTPEHFISWGPY